MARRWSGHSLSLSLSLGVWLQVCLQRGRTGVDGQTDGRRRLTDRYGQGGYRDGEGKDGWRRGNLGGIKGVKAWARVGTRRAWGIGRV
ncbi:hypothetical protein F4861DRAFT_351024 [Xylaria intraflava]|nr:hypothetical protein F4861DRAFT_351024 [Xylaria intraflava]